MLPEELLDKCGVKLKTQMQSQIYKNGGAIANKINSDDDDPTSTVANTKLDNILSHPVTQVIITWSS